MLKHVLKVGTSHQTLLTGSTCVSLAAKSR